jgi:HEAT repeat protein
LSIPRFLFRALGALLACVVALVIAPLAAYSQTRTQPQTQPQPPTPTAVVLSVPQVKLAQQSAWDLLNKTFLSQNSSERRDAVAALSLIGNGQSVSMIETALSDKSPEVRAQAINCLVDLNARDAIPKLKPLLKDSSPEVVFTAARALSQLGDPSGRDVLIEVLTGERHVSGSMVGSGLTWAKQLSPVNVLFFGVGEAATIVVAPYAGIGVSVVRQLTADHTSPARITAAQSLANDDNQRVTDILEKALHDHNWAIRAASAQALGNFSSTAPILQLTPLLKDKKREVRLVAASSIIRLASPPPSAAFDAEKR